MVSWAASVQAVKGLVRRAVVVWGVVARARRRRSAAAAGAARGGERCMVFCCGFFEFKRNVIGYD
jgi:hypothetical protein